MLIFRTPADIPKARLPPHLHQLMTLQMKALQIAYTSYNADEDGHLILITPTDTDSQLCKKLGLFWSENLFEGVLYNTHYKIFITMILRNNQFGITLLIPDEPWLETGIRTRMIMQMEGGGGYC